MCRLDIQYRENIEKQIFANWSNKIRTPSPSYISVRDHAHHASWSYEEIFYVYTL
jgi:hypothetical protein